MVIIQFVFEIYILSINKFVKQYKITNYPYISKYQFSVIRNDTDWSFFLVTIKSASSKLKLMTSSARL